MPVELSESDRQLLLTACVEATEALASGYIAYQKRIRPVPLVSEAPAIQVREFIVHKYGPSGSWSVDLVDEITSRALIYQSGALQYLNTMTTLATYQPYGLGIGPISRSMVEICGKICWLLDNRLGLKDGLRPRVARLMLDRLNDATHRKRLMVDLGHPDRALAGDLWRAARNDVAKPGLFYKSEIDDSDASSRVTLAKQALPSPSKLIDIAVDVLSSTGSHDGVYRYLSSMTHPTIFALVETFPLMDDPDNNMPYLRPRSDAIFSAKLISLGSLAFYDGWRIIASWLGTSFDEATDFHDRHEGLQRMLDEFQR